MKTLTLLLGILLCGFRLSAQFNNTYDNNYNSDQLYHGRVIETSDLGTVFLSMSSGGGVHYAMASKIDQFGNPVWNKKILPFDPTTEFITETAALVEMDDQGILIAGFIYTTAGTRAPLTIKLDASGSFVWSHYYDVNSNYVSSHNKISIIRVEDDPAESYFIVANSSNDYQSGYCAVNVIKVDINGDMIWSKKYYDVLMNAGFSTVRDVPGDIAYSPANNLYMISGWRQQWVFGMSSEMFFFGIDLNGDLLTQFKTIQTPGYPFGQDMVYNPALDVFAVTYTHGNTNYAAQLCEASGIGLLTIDASLNIGFSNYYWPDEGYENYGYSISLGEYGKTYIIGCFNYRYDCISPNGYRNPALLKVWFDGSPIWYARYNILDDASFGIGSSITCTGASGSEEYLLVSENNTDSRVIRTDINGKACGVVFYNVLVIPYVPVDTYYNYYWDPQFQNLDYFPFVVDEKIPYRDCDSAGTWDYYSAEDTGSGSGTIAISGQHQLSSNASEITITNESNTTSTVEIYNIAGTLVMQGQIAPEARTVPLKSADLSTGMYIVRFKDLNGKLISTDKIIVAD